MIACVGKYRAMAGGEEPLGPWRDSLFKASRDAQKVRLGDYAEIVQLCAGGVKTEIICSREQTRRGVKLYCDRTKKAPVVPFDDPDLDIEMNGLGGRGRGHNPRQRVKRAKKRCKNGVVKSGPRKGLCRLRSVKAKSKSKAKARKKAASRVTGPRRKATAVCPRSHGGKRVWRDGRGRCYIVLSTGRKKIVPRRAKARRR